MSVMTALLKQEKTEPHFSSHGEKAPFSEILSPASAITITASETMMCQILC